MHAAGTCPGTALGLRPMGAVEARKRPVPAVRMAAHASLRGAKVSAAAAQRAFNFSAGPAILPLDVLKQAQEEMLDWHGSGMSVLEMSHRGPEFESIIAKAEKDLRTLMKIPDNYKARHPLPTCSPVVWVAHSRVD